MDSVETYTKKIDTLPTAPRILTELLPLIQQEDVDAQRITEIIKYDPGLTAKVLRRANSAASGGSEPVQSIADAITRLGFNEIYRLVAAVVGQSTLGGANEGYGIAAGGLWQHSAATAIAAKGLAADLGQDENVAFTCGLMHDVGKILLNSALVTAYPEVALKIVNSGQSFLEAEREILGIDHAELGGRVLQQWNFPDQFVQAVWHHHDPIQAKPHERTAGIVHVADMIAHTLGYGDGSQSHATRSRLEVLQMLEITPREIERFILQTDCALKASTWFASES
jgi:putative nucleotidyltransferase with HDIG domain